MEKSTLHIGIKRIQDAFEPKKYTAEALRVAWEQIQHEDDACLKPAVDKLIIEAAPGMIPPLSKLIANVREVAISRREQTAQKENFAFPRLSEIQPATNYGRDCLNNIRALFDGLIDKKEYLTQAFRIVDKHNRPKEECLWIDEQWQ